VEDHRATVAALAARLTPGGQLALQMPSNPDSAFSRCAEAVARSAEFSAELGGWCYRSPVQEPAFYSRLLDELGFVEQRVGAWHYPQVHERARGLADFARGGLLSGYRERLPPARFEAFAAAYEAELERALGPGRVFFPFRRVLVWGARGERPPASATAP
jgi:trans-aconitate 2-methyltransferase